MHGALCARPCMSFAQPPVYRPPALAGGVSDFHCLPLVTREGGASPPYCLTRSLLSSTGTRDGVKVVITLPCASSRIAQLLASSALYSYSQQCCYSVLNVRGRYVAVFASLRRRLCSSIVKGILLYTLTCVNRVNCTFEKTIYGGGEVFFIYKGRNPKTRNFRDSRAKNGI